MCISKKTKNKIRAVTRLIAINPNKRLHNVLCIVVPVSFSREIIYRCFCSMTNLFLFANCSLTVDMRAHRFPLTPTDFLSITAVQSCHWPSSTQSPTSTLCSLTSTISQPTAHLTGRSTREVPDWTVAARAGSSPGILYE